MMIIIINVVAFVFFAVITTLLLLRDAHRQKQTQGSVQEGSKKDASEYKQVVSLKSEIEILRSQLKQAQVAAEKIGAEHKMRKLIEQAERLGAQGIAGKMAVLADTDARMKGMGTLPNEVELQLCLGRLLSA